MGNRQDLTTGTVWKKLLLFFLPIAAGTIMQQLYNAVDGMVVAKYVGTEALAAVGGSSSQIINLLIGFFTAMTAGAAVVIAQVFGAGKVDDVKKATGSGIAICFFISLVLMAVGLIGAEWMLSFLDTPEETIADAALYLRIYFIGVPAILLLNMQSNMLRAVGDSRSPFLFMLVGCGTNIILDILFVKVFGWGVMGVAVATVIANLLNMLCLTWQLLTTKQAYRISIQDIRLNKQFLKSMLRLGIPSGLQSTMYAVSNMIIQVSVNSLGTLVVASWTMSGKIDGFFWATTNALGSAITAFIGQNIGAGKDDRVKQCVKQGLIVSLLITVSESIILLLIGYPVLGILTDDRAVVDTTYQIMIYMVPYYFSWCIIEVLSGVLRGAGDAVKPVIIIGLGICLLRIIWMWTMFAAFKSLFVLCMAYPVSWAVTDIIFIFYYKKARWREHLKLA